MVSKTKVDQSLCLECTEIKRSRLKDYTFPRKNSTFSGFLKSIESVFCFWVCKKLQDDKKTSDVRGVLLQTIKGESKLHLA